MMRYCADILTFGYDIAVEKNASHALDEYVNFNDAVAIAGFPRPIPRAILQARFLSP